MGASIIAMYRTGGEGYSTGATDYQYPGGAVELDQEGRFYVSEAGVVKAISVHVATNTCNQAVDVAFHKNGTVSSVKKTIASTATGWQVDDSGDELSVAAGDYIQIEFTSASGTGSLNYTRLMFLFVPTTTTNSVTWASYNNTSSTAINNVSETVFFGPWGARERDTVEANSDLEIPLAGTVKYFQTTLGTNQRTTTTTVTFRSDATNRAPTFDVAATDGSPHQDTSNTYSIAANEAVSYGFAMGSDSGNSFNVEKTGFNLVNSSAQFFVAATDPVGGTNLLDGEAGYVPPCGVLSKDATEGNVQMRIPPGFNGNILSIFAESKENTLTGDDVTFTVRVNGAAPSPGIALVFPTGGTDTGFFSETGSISVSPGDLVSIHYDASTSTGTRLRLAQIGLVMEEVAAGNDGAVSFAADMGSSFTADALSFGSISSGVSAGDTESADALADGSNSFGVTANSQFSSVVVAEATLSESLQADYTTTSEVVAGGETEAAVTFGCELNGVVSADAQAAAVVLFSAGLTSDVVADATAEAVIAAGNILGYTNTGEVIAGGGAEEGVVAFSSQMAAQVSADAQAEASVLMTPQLAASVVANAATEAGLEVAQVLGVTFLGQIVSGQIITPDGRTFTVQAETRVFTVLSRSNTFTVN